MTKKPTLPLTESPESETSSKSSSSDNSSTSSKTSNSTKSSRSSKPAPKRSNNQVDEMEQLLRDIAAKKYKNIVVMAGAGISTAAGIPDFRSPHTGLYANLQKFKLPYPEAVFDIDYLPENPEPFYMLAREMYPSQFSPTTFHTFLKWLSELGCLRRVYTQNIDTLERRAGVPDDLIVEAHGSFATSSCIECRTAADPLEIEEDILVRKQIPKCVECEGLVKPDIVFFGESLPQRFFETQDDDFDVVDLAIVAGTSLKVSPFNLLPEQVPRGVPRVLLNMERVGTFGSRKHDKLVLGPLEGLDEVLSEYIHPRKVEVEEEEIATVEVPDISTLKIEETHTEVHKEVHST